jgi:hypothetical protein
MQRYAAEHHHDSVPGTLAEDFLGRGVHQAQPPDRYPSRGVNSPRRFSPICSRTC